MSPARPPRHVRVFLASPGDVSEERRLARLLLERIEREPLVRGRFTIEVVSWDDPDAPAPMLATLSPQEAVRRALPKPSECDLTVVILWGRMGTPLDEHRADGTRYLSGTEWEFEDAARESRPVLLYRRAQPPEATGTDADRLEMKRQRSLVEGFFARLRGPGGVLRGGFTTYQAPADFEERLRRDVLQVLDGLGRQPDRDGERPRGPKGWHRGQLALVWIGGGTVTLIAATAFFSMPPAPAGGTGALAYILEAVLSVVAVGVPAALIRITWQWLGRGSG